MTRTGRMPTSILRAGILLLVGFALAGPTAGQAPAAAPSVERPEAARQSLLQAYATLPLRFEANRGQTDARVDFVARGRGYTLYLTATEAVLVLREGKAHSRVLQVKLIGANAAPQVAGLDPLPGATHYIVRGGADARHASVPTYARVEYREVYPGVSLVYYGNRGQLEYDFVVAPGADPRRIRLAFAGADSMEIDGGGDLVLRTAGGEIRQHKPLIYQEVDGVRREISGGYVLTAEHQVGLAVGAYDPDRPLVIDPVLSYSTYFGGEGFSEDIKAIAVDAAGYAYVTGQTDSTTNFPTVNPSQGTHGGPFIDAFVAKLSPEGTLVYSTYLGGSSDESGLGIAVDRSGNGSVYVTGFTHSPNFPTVGAFQTTFGGGFAPDAFVAKLDGSGRLVYSRYLGRDGMDEGRAIAVDSSGNAYVTGFTASSGFATAGAYQGVLRGGGDAFVAKLNAGGSALVYLTYLGGNGFDSGIGIAVDGTGSAYVTGEAGSDFPTAGPYQPAAGGSGDAFVTKVNADGSALVYSTYLGGSGMDGGRGIAVDGSGYAYVTGFTTSSDFPKAGPLQTSFGGGFGTDAFVTKFNAAGSALVYSLYLGGSGSDEANAIAVDAWNNAYVTGWSDSPNFPRVAPLEPVAGTGEAGDAFETKINAGGSALVYSTFLGGGSMDAGRAIAVDASGNTYVAGETFSSLDFPTANPSIPVVAGDFGRNGFVARIPNPEPPVLMVPFASFSLRLGGSDDDDGDNVRGALQARFTLGAGSNGIDPTREEVIVQVGANSVTIPAGYFRQDRKGRFKYDGIINGVRVKSTIRSLGNGSYKFDVKGEDAEKYRRGRRDRAAADPSFWWGSRPARAKGPVTVALTIGNDGGTMTWTGKAAQRGTRGRDRDD